MVKGQKLKIDTNVAVLLSSLTEQVKKLKKFTGINAKILVKLNLKLKIGVKRNEITIYR